MKQTHKFQALAAEAKAVVASSSSVTVAAKALGVSRDTLHTWIRDGKVPRPAAARTQPAKRRSVTAGDAADRGRRKGERFADWCRRVLVLNAAEDEVVDLAQQALDASKDPTLSWSVRLAASREYRACRRDLNLPDEGAHDDGDVQTTTPGWPRAV
jgi:DNA invertase Pin-like site-specific DNA recombinase